MAYGACLGQGQGVALCHFGCLPAMGLPHVGAAEPSALAQYEVQDQERRLCLAVRIDGASDHRNARVYLLEAERLKRVASFC